MIRAVLRPLGRGARDTLDHLLPFTLVSISWWFGVLLVVTAPAATLALFRYADPRALEDQQRPERRELLRLVRGWIATGWQLSLLFAVPVGVLVRNLVVYREFGALGTWLLPVWVVLLLLAITAAGIACSLVAVHGCVVSTAARRAALITLSRSPFLAPVVVLLWIVVAVGGILAVPAVMFIPTLVANTLNHLTYEALGIEVADPLEPTVERRAEQQREEASKYASN